MRNPDREHASMREIRPSEGNLRWAVKDDDNGVTRKLQRFEWCQTEMRFGWFDVEEVHGES